ncbi:nucleoside 2-deoxyribosyltransferase [Rossellomorea sp. KS-H15a]|uniref:nucleoside 2-deoxyribosyltransferase n=1 Tax=Rossellomorea sp. KS-H15a TaxID=2963940 RepID=UPI0020C69484|nr:nucleoside 2-deoxyribosyltransferase [Rossellomorea sp. KS-H15a]UTE76733.1 nucleoside 2-deoxyribosyltransferase [Rossellomorea sp. KS-H15a]
MESTIIRNVRVFIASPFFSEEQVDRVQRLEQSLMQNPYVSEIFSARFHQYEHLEFGSKEWRRKVFRNDLRNLRRSDVLVGIRDYEGKYVDSGTAFEIGYANSMRKPILLINEKNSVMNLMMAESLHAYFTKVEELATYDFHRMPKAQYEGPVI